MKNCNEFLESCNEIINILSDRVFKVTCFWNLILFGPWVKSHNQRNIWHHVWSVSNSPNLFLNYIHVLPISLDSLGWAFGGVQPSCAKHKSHAVLCINHKWALVGRIVYLSFYPPITLVSLQQLIWRMIGRVDKHVKPHYLVWYFPPFHYLLAYIFIATHRCFIIQEGHAYVCGLCPNSIRPPFIDFLTL